jgi:ferric-dicitrate binding protein FerR (iron transport regulator)
MTERDDRRQLPDESELLRLVGSTPVAAPSAEARERARAAFVSGAAPVAATPITSAPRRAGWGAYVPLALAASLLALVIWGLQPTDDWTVLDVVAADGASVPGGPSAGTRFGSGLATTDVEAELDLQLGDRLRIRVAPDSRAILPRGPGRWIGKSRRLIVESGEIFGTTEGRPLGFELVLVTPDAEARILGTTFAVTWNELGPCFCLYDGEIEVTTGDRAPVRVPKRMRIQCYEDGRPPHVDDLTDQERTKLRMIQEAGIGDRPSE